MYDVLIIGGGPAGLSAAIYSARGGCKTAILDGNVFGGELADIKEIENYPGFSGRGLELAESMKKQAASFGAELITQNAESITSKDGVFSVMTQTALFKAKSVIIASGIKRKSNPMYDKMYGSGVSYCATCDGFFYKGETVAVVGGGNTAAEDALYLSDLCKSVYLINLKPELRCENSIADKLSSKENVTVLNSHSVKGILGRLAVEGITVFDLKALEEKNLAVTGIFVAMGHFASKPLINGLEVNESGEIIVSEGSKTSIEGVFAAGDATNSPLKQVVTAASQGALAATAAVEYVKGK